MSLCEICQDVMSIFLLVRNLCPWLSTSPRWRIEFITQLIFKLGPGWGRFLSFKLQPHILWHVTSGIRWTNPNGLQSVDAEKLVLTATRMNITVLRGVLPSVVVLTASIIRADWARKHLWNVDMFVSDSTLPSHLRIKFDFVFNLFVFYEFRQRRCESVFQCVR